MHEDNAGCEAPTCETARTPRPIGNQAIRPRDEIQPAPAFYEVVVTKAENGFILRFGCKTFVAKNWEEAATGIGEYWKDPYAAQKKYTA